MERVAARAAALEAGDVAVLDAIDLEDPSWREAIRAALGQPGPIEVTEAIESAVKQWWVKYLVNSAFDADASFKFSAFFAELGFLKKYKPYGVKFSSPFGHSIFQLRDGLGFSVQLHRVAKVEAFHILDAESKALGLICSVAEWEANSAEIKAAVRRGCPEDSALSFRPTPGDVFVVEDVEVVHTVLGCTLEEFATTSNDAVDRLFDQNDRVADAVPEVHPSLEAILKGCASFVPETRVSRNGPGWIREPLDRGCGRFVDMPDRGLVAEHVSMHGGQALPMPVDDDAVSTFVCLEGAAVVSLPGGEVPIGPADAVPVAPGESPVLRSEVDGTRISVCTVAREMAFADCRLS